MDTKTMCFRSNLQRPKPVANVVPFRRAVVKSKTLVLLALCVGGSQAIGADAGTYMQMALGGGYEITILFSNKGPFQARCRIDFGQVTPGDPVKGLTIRTSSGIERRDIPSLDLDLPGFATRRVVLTADIDSRAVAGILTARGAPHTSVATSVVYGYRTSSGKLLNSAAAISSGTWAKQFFFPVEKSLRITTAIAWFPGLGRTNIYAVLTDQDGNEVRKKFLEPSDFQRSMFLDEMFSEIPLPLTFVGMLRLQGDNNFDAVALRFESADDGTFQFTTIPADIAIP